MSEGPTALRDSIESLQANWEQFRITNQGVHELLLREAWVVQHIAYLYMTLEALKKPAPTTGIWTPGG